MAVIKIKDIQETIYIIMGIDANEHDQILAARYRYEDAKEYCKQFQANSVLDMYDLWIEKIPLK